MITCKYYDEEWETCVCGDCPACADYCPLALAANDYFEMCCYYEPEESESCHREPLN